MSRITLIVIQILQHFLIVRGRRPACVIPTNVDSRLVALRMVFFQVGCDFENHGVVCI